MWNSSGAARIQSDPPLSPSRAVSLLPDHHLHELLEVEAAVIVFVRLKCAIYVNNQKSSGTFLQEASSSYCPCILTEPTKNLQLLIELPDQLPTFILHAIVFCTTNLLIHCMCMLRRPVQ